ncbi:hypothetical protein L9F63_017930, partial [Diploptera punctata]
FCCGRGRSICPNIALGSSSFFIIPRSRPCGLWGILECQFWKSISCHSSQMIFPF